MAVYQSNNLDALKYLKEKVVNQDKIFNLIKNCAVPKPVLLKKILLKALAKKGLNLEEVAILLSVEDEGSLAKIFAAASKIKQEIYGNRLVLFAPLYISNYCVNNCAYCSFHKDNPAARKKLTLAEVGEQAEILISQGHKRLLLEFGEHPEQNDIDFVGETIKRIYETKKDRGEIRRVNVNIAATSLDDYKKLKQAGIGTYQLFQETYHEPTYKKLHCGPKANFDRQLTAHERALAAGIDDLGFGVLFGLYDYHFDVLALIAHAQYFDKIHGIGPHTISVPRLKPAETVDYRPEFPVSDKDFLKIIAVIRLAVPYTGIIISTRESAEIRQKAFQIGISQTSAGSKTSPGGYGRNDEARQFEVSDQRSLDEVVQDICELGYIPSFCTACYRSARTGERFMALAKIGQIQYLCQPNALQTFLEYLLDYASPETKAAGEKVISQEIEKIFEENVKNKLISNLDRIRAGERDLYF